MMHKSYSVKEVLKFAKTRLGLARWVSRHMVRVLEDCPECGAIPELGQTHGMGCPYHPYNEVRSATPIKPKTISLMVKKLSHLKTIPELAKALGRSEAWVRKQLR